MIRIIIEFVVENIFDFFFRISNNQWSKWQFLNRGISRERFRVVVFLPWNLGNKNLKKSFFKLVITTINTTQCQCASATHFFILFLLHVQILGDIQYKVYLFVLIYEAYEESFFFFISKHVYYTKKKRGIY